MKNRAPTAMVNARFGDCRDVPWRVSTDRTAFKPRLWQFFTVVSFHQRPRLVPKLFS